MNNNKKETGTQNGDVLDDDVPSFSIIALS